MQTFLRTSIKPLVAFALLWLSTSTGLPDQRDSERIDRLESQVSTLERQFKDYGDAGVVLFFFGAFCALWAQNTRRSAWLWFFLGLFFNVVTVMVLLFKNSQDKSSGK